MPKRLLILLLYFFLTAIKINSQPRSYSYSFELGGVGGFGSFNFEQNIYSKTQCQFLWRTGFSIAPIDKNNGTVLIFPILIHGQFGKSAHKLDLGIGQSFSITTRGNFFLLLPCSIGYLHAPFDKKLWFRLAYTPIISYLFDTQYQHWGGLTIGYRIK